ncbi:hypothetical protein EB796_015683 [Bugula neritina]|uniref:Uncharacterized protein n=1 Tax=Bugula neritina TaxID=10212 RepID=A0A7J7JK84_BUGNE|nr:hypothetical protein EB796_015683 [Bugula neritina]
MFALKTQSQLVEGDSGSIVYLNPPDGILRPIAMYVQKIVLSSPNRSNDPKNPFQAPHYKAILLYHAFRNLEADYPHHIGKIHQIRERQ